MKSHHNNLPNNQPKNQMRNKKISRIWCLARDLGMGKGKDSDLYLIVESVTGKDSISELDMIELNIVARNLQTLLLKKKRQRYLNNTRQRKTDILYLPTPEQKALVSDYMAKLTEKLKLNFPDLYKESICRRTFRKDYKKLNRGEIQRLIEALKSIYSR